MTQPDSPCRVLCVQPTLAKYRAPVWRELASRPGIRFRLWHGRHGSIKNVDPEGFEAEHKPLTSRRFLGQEVLWHAAQLEAAADADADALILSWGSRYLSLGPALRRAKRRGTPVVLWGHGYSKNDSGWRRWARNRMANLASVLMFYDERSAAAAVRGGWSSDRVFVAPNAIDQRPIAAARSDWLADEERLGAFKRENDLTGRDVILYVSRFSPENRVELLLDAVDEMRRSRPEVLAALIGGGELHERIAGLVARRGLEGHVRLLGPIYGEDRLAPWFLSARVFAYPAAIGLSLLHAFGYGLPVVTDDNVAGQNPEIVAFQPRPGPSQNGLDYPAGDPGGLADALTRLLDDDALRERLAAAALAAVQQRFNIGSMVDGIEAAARRAVELGR